MPANTAAIEFRLEQKQPSVIAGTAQQVRAEFDRLHRICGITESVIDTPVASKAERLGSIALIAGTAAQVLAAE